MQAINCVFALLCSLSQKTEFFFTIFFSLEGFPQHFRSVSFIIPLLKLRRLISQEIGALQLYLTKRLQHRCFPMNFVKFCRITFFKKTSGNCLFKGGNESKTGKIFVHLIKKDFVCSCLNKKVSGKCKF